MSQPVIATVLNDAYRHHIGLRPSCGICGSVAAIGERFIALLGNSDSTSCLYQTDSSVFPDYGHNIRRVDNISLCRRPDCRQCASSAEAATIHSGCFQLFIREYKCEDALDRLWTIAAWRSPWRQAPNLRLADGQVIVPDLSAAEALGLPKLRNLPPEIVQWIRNYSMTSLFWRYSSALDLARGLSKAASKSASEDIVSIPLSGISTWKRGELPPVVAPLKAPAHAITPKTPIIRLTIDSYGIKEVERLQEMPPYRSRRSDRLAFVIVEEHYLKHAVMHFKFGLSRLQLPESVLGLQIRDRPTPPDLQRCIVSADIPRSARLHTIAFQRTVGITFFFCLEEVYAIHAHTATAPYAEVTYKDLPARRQQTVSWLYIPIPENDRVLAFGIRQKRSGKYSMKRLCLLFRTSLAGDITIGPPYSEDTSGNALSTGSPEILIYNTAETRPISVIGAYSDTRQDSGRIAPFCPSQAGEPPFQNAYFSSAPLENVIGIQVFDERKGGFCRGILLEYENGGQRALGQCRFGVDLARVYRKPVRICLFRTTHVRPGTERRFHATRVEISNQYHHSHDEEGWICSTLEGNLEFWFTNEQSDITVVIDE